MIVYNHALLGMGAWYEIVLTCALGLAAVWMMSIALVGWYQRHVNVAWRLVLAVAAICCLTPVLWAHAIALVVLLAFAATSTNWLKKRNAPVVYS